jgi:hypothetical protein
MFLIRTYFRIMWLWFLLTAGGTALAVTVLLIGTQGFGSDGLVHLQEQTDANGDTFIVPDSLNNVVERREVFEAVPLPSQVSTEPPVVATNVGLTAFLAILFGMISVMLNNLLRQKEDRLEGWLGLVGLDKLWALFRMGTGQGIQRGCLGMPFLVIVFALYGLIFAYVEEGLDITQTVDIQLAVVLAMTGAIVSLSGDFAQRQVAFFWRKTARYAVYPANLLVAVITTLISRSLNLSPGILYGVPGGVDVEDMEDEPPFRQVVLIAVTMLVLFGLGAGGWGLVSFLDSSGDRTLSGTALQFTGPLFALAQTIGFAIFVMALETAFFEMAPVGLTMGGQLFRWSALVWLVFFGLSTFGFLHVLLNPRTEYLDAFEQIGVQALLGAVITLAIITALVWLFLTFIDPPGYKARLAAQASGSGTQQLYRTQENPPYGQPPQRPPVQQQPYQPPTRYQSPERTLPTRQAPPPPAPPTEFRGDQTVISGNRPPQAPLETTQISGGRQDQPPPSSLDATQINPSVQRDSSPPDSDSTLDQTRLSTRPPDSPDEPPPPQRRS